MLYSFRGFFDIIIRVRPPLGALGMSPNGICKDINTKERGSYNHIRCSETGAR